MMRRWKKRPMRFRSRSEQSEDVFFGGRVQVEKQPRGFGGGQTADEVGEVVDAARKPSGLGKRAPSA